MSSNANARVTIFGHEYTVKAAAEDQYIKDIAAYVDQRMRETELNLTDGQSPTRVAILAAMSITDELFTEKRKRQGALDNIEKKASAIFDYVDEVIHTSK